MRLLTLVLLLSSLALSACASWPLRPPGLLPPVLTRADCAVDCRQLASLQLDLWRLGDFSHTALVPADYDLAARELALAAQALHADAVVFDRLTVEAHSLLGIPYATIAVTGAAVRLYAQSGPGQAR